MSKLCGKIEKNTLKIIELLNQNIDLRRQIIIDKATEIKTVEKNFGTKKQPKLKQVKIAVYPEKFTDEDTGESITVQRNYPLEVDGLNCDSWGRELVYYDINNLSL